MSSDGNFRYVVWEFDHCEQWRRIGVHADLPSAWNAYIQLRTDNAEGNYWIFYDKI